MNPCAIPEISKDIEGDDRWLSIHKRFCNECREKDPDVIFLGDNITESLENSATWRQFFAPLHCLNFSIRNDKTQNILWRVENGELDNVKPKIVVLHVGTNNTDDPADEIAEGIIKIIDKIKEKLPEANIVFPALLPRGHLPNSLREKNKKVNLYLKEKLNQFNKVHIIEIDKNVIQPDGTISHHTMFDYLNLTNAGSKVFEPVYELLAQILEPLKDLTPSE